MKVAHVCLSNFYIDGVAYQENMLVREHVKMGHDVVVIASTENFDNDRRITYVAPGEYAGGDGARVIRLPYRNLRPPFLARKLRMHRDVAGLLEQEAPDVVMFHGLCGWELLTVSRYARRNPDVVFRVDSHEDKYNSAREFLSKNVLHRLYYRPIIRRSAGAFSEVLCVSLETIDFVNEMYGLPRKMLEFFPLGGTVLSDEEYTDRRDKARQTLGLSSGDVLLVQTGKLSPRKKVLETLEAFVATEGENLRLVLAGTIDDSIAADAQRLIDSDTRIEFVGWCETEALTDLLCGADVYVQPGTQSATMQMSLCARCAVILDDVPSHAPFVRDNGWLLAAPGDLELALEQVGNGEAELQEMSERSLALATELLDYRKLAERVVSPVNA